MLISTEFRRKIRHFPSIFGYIHVTILQDKKETLGPLILPENSVVITTIRYENACHYNI